MTAFSEADDLDAADDLDEVTEIPGTGGPAWLRRLAGSLLLRRVLMIPVVAFVVAVLVFVVARLLPGDPVRQMTATDSSITPAQVAQLRRQLGLSAPMPVQFWDYLKGIFTGNMGVSIYSGRPVSSLLGAALPVTVELAVSAAILATLMGIVTGMVAARFQGSWIDAGIRTGATIGFSLPWFVVAVVAIIIFGVDLNWLPILGRMPNSIGYQPTTGFVVIDAVLQDRYDLIVPWLQHLVLPATTLAATSAGFMTRVTRAALLDAQSQNFVRTARMKGLTERAITVKHVLRNGAVPILTMGGLQLGGLLGGAVITEAVFSYPGVGSLLVQAAERRDYFLLQGAALVIGVLFTSVNAAVDIAVIVIDPRRRHA
jgi:peptide/nickel transport system permease protein